MKTLNRPLLAAALLGSGAPLFLLAAAVPAAAQAPRPAEAPTPVAASPTVGKVLLLHNESTLEGDIERIGDQYRVRHALGETWLNADGALRLCAGFDDALAFLRGRANLDDADERLRLAQWCRDHGLRAQMLDEVRAAVQLRPDNAETRRILAHLEQNALAPVTAPPLPEPIEVPPSPAFEVTAEAAGQFATRVQPILMNTCAPCHAGGRGGAFKLTRAYDTTNRRAMQTNLAAVLAQVNAGQPAASPFLAKAASLHGEMAQAPFKNRQAPAFRTLEDWVCLTVRTNPQLRGEPSAVPPPPIVLPPPVPTPPAVFGDERTGTPAAVRPEAPTPEPVTIPPPPNVAPPVEPVARSVPTTPRPGPAAPAPPDAFDPDEFNRANHAPPP